MRANKVTKNSLIALIIFGSLGIFNSCGRDINLNIPGVTGPIMTIAGQGIIISLVLENLSPPAGFRTPIPKFTRSHAEVGPDFESDGTLISFYLSFQDLLDENGNIRSLPANTLPGGRPLPGIRAGALPSIAFTVDYLRGTTFYLGTNFFGIFVPLRLGVLESTGIITTRFYFAGNRAGNLSVVGYDENDENGGLLLLLDLTKQVRQEMRQLVKNPRSFPTQLPGYYP